MTIESFADACQAVASGTPPNEAARELVAAMTPDERLWCLDGDRPALDAEGFRAEDGYHRAPFVAARVDRLGIPGIAFSDGPRGCVIGNSTCFPVSMARGATWDPELEERVGEAIGEELRAVDANLTGAVCVNLLRHPAWGRAQETYGEEPFHVGAMAAAFTRGLQQHVMACVKHFACNSMENARFSVDIAVDEVALHEIFLPHFRRVVEEGVASVMSAYNSVNGEWCGQNRDLLTGILRDEWGFEGFVISDWIFGLRDAAKSVAAGLDIEMPYRMVRSQHLPDALERSEASWADVDAAVERIVATLLHFSSVISQPSPPVTVLGSPEHRHLAQEVAARSVVLLRNDPVDGSPLLPLAPDQGRVAVLGRLASTVNLGDGGSSDVWDVDCRTVLEGLQAEFADVVHDDGSDTSRAAAVASETALAVVVVGYTHLDEGEFIGRFDPALLELFPPADEPEVVERFQASIAAIPPVVRPAHLADRKRGFSVGGDRSSLRLHDPDVELIRAVSAANPRTIVVIQAGSAVVASEWIDSVPTVVQAWYGGCRAGPALVDVLVGRVNPSGRLPFTVPVDETHLPPFDRDATRFRYDRWHGWRHLARSGVTPAFPFGFGLSYTTFELGRVDVSAAGSLVKVRGVLHNTGARDGSDVVQLYAQLPDAGAPDRLVGFTRSAVPAGASANFEIEAPVEHLATRDPDRHQWERATGAHTFLVSRYAGDPSSVAVTIDL